MIRVVVRGFISFLLDMLAPPICVHCGSEIREEPSLEGVSVPAGWTGEVLTFFDHDHGILCLDCWLRLEPARNPSLPAGPSPGGGSPGLITPFYTNDVLLSLVRFLKFEDGVTAVDPLSWWMAYALRRCCNLSGDPAIVVPVPLHPRRRRRRGYDQAALLAGRVADHLELPIDDRILMRFRPTKSQARLGEEARDRNVRNAFRLAGGGTVRGRHIILVDDLVTSGGTARSCIGCLLPAGPARVTVLAAGRRKILSYNQIIGGA
jgi:ComF family protein